MRLEKAANSKPTVRSMGGGVLDIRIDSVPYT